MDELKHIIESLLFVAHEPIGIDRIRKILPHVEADDIRAALASLGAEYDARKGGFYLCEVAGGFQLRSRPEYGVYNQQLFERSASRLSRAALETLAIIAYKQPIIRSDIEHIRGVDSGGVLRMLLERKLVRVLGRKDIPGRPMIYGTTKKFLEVFDLKDLKDLPSPKEIEELGNVALDSFENQEQTAAASDGDAAPDSDGTGLREPPSLETDATPGLSTADSDDPESLPEPPGDGKNA